MLRFFMRTRTALRGMHPAWSRGLCATTALGYLYGHVYGNEERAGRVVEIAQRHQARVARRIDDTPAGGAEGQATDGN